MRSVEDKGSLNSSGSGSAQELSGVSCIGFDFHRRSHAGKFHASHHRPTPSKWDDAQKWLVNLSRGEKNQPKSSPRNSSADDRRLISVAAFPTKDEDLASEEGMDMDSNDCRHVPENVDHRQYGNEDIETKDMMDCSDESVWRINKAVNYDSKSVVRSVCVRDMGTEMTPIASQEPSRTATPIRTAAATTTARIHEPLNGQERHVITPATRMADAELSGERNKTKDESKVLNPLEMRAIAWDEAERAKYMARYKREEVKIQAWENHQKRKAEMEMRSIEAKADRLKYRAQEKYTNRLAETRRIAEEKRANAEAVLNEKAVKTSESADYIRTTGHLPSSFSFKCCSLCW